MSVVNSDVHKRSVTMVCVNSVQLLQVFKPVSYITKYRVFPIESRQMFSCKGDKEVTVVHVGSEIVALKNFYIFFFYESELLDLEVTLYFVSEVLLVLAFELSEVS